MSRWRDGLAELRARREVERAISDADLAAYNAKYGELDFWTAVRLENEEEQWENEEQQWARRAVSDTLDALPYQGLVPRAIARRRTQPTGFLGPDSDLDALWGTTTSERRGPDVA